VSRSESSYRYVCTTMMRSDGLGCTVVVCGEEWNLDENAPT
jgi:hypothetical protein